MPSRRDCGSTHSRAAMTSATPPALSVVHITETDVAAHLYGTERPEFVQVLRFWDEQLDAYLRDVLRPGTTVIITADHGNDLIGSHGGADPIYRRVPVLMLGAGVEAGARIEMQSIDMPVTLASLLALRAPSGAMGLPAVHGLQLRPAERAQLTLTAYYHGVIQHQLVRERPELQAEARAAVQGRLDDPHFRWVSDADADRLLSGVRTKLAQLEPMLGAWRVWQVTDWLFVVATFALALSLGWVARPVLPAVRDLSFSWWWGGAAALLLIEGVFMARVALLPLMRGWATEAGSPFKLVLAAMAVVATVIALLAWTLRRRWWPALRAHPEWSIALAFVLVTISYPLTSMGLMAMAIAAGLLMTAPWPVRWGQVALALTWAYALVGPQLWSRLGEDLGARFRVGVPLAVVGALAVWAALRRWQATAWLLAAAFGGLLYLQPGSGWIAPWLAEGPQRLLATGVMLVLILVLDQLWYKNLSIL